MVTRNRTGRRNRSSAGNGRTPPPRSPRASDDTLWQSLQRAWSSIGRRVPRMRDDLSCYASVQVDRIRMRVAHTIGHLTVGAVLVLTLAAITTVAATLVMLGVVGGLATLLDGKLWLAALLTGASVLLGLLLAVRLGMRAQARRRLTHLQHRYRRRAPAPDAAPTPVPTGENHAH